MDLPSAAQPCKDPRDNLSHVRGSTDSQLSSATIAALLADTVSRFGDRPAVVFREQNVRWTWTRFSAEVDHFAARLVSLGLCPGDRLGIWSPNRVEWIVTQFATARIGVILVNINPAYRLHELEYALNTSGCRAIVSAERLRTSHYLEMLLALAPELTSCEPGKLASVRLPSLRLVIRMGDGHTPGMLRYSDAIARGASASDVQALDRITASLDCHDPINIQFTSGTTGSPKGATLTHHNIVNNARFVAEAMRFDERDALCIPVPLYHCFGMVMSALACTATGAKMVFPGEVFDPSATLAAASEEKCTALHGVPTMFICELDAPDFAQYDLSTLRTGIMAGAPCPIETMKRVVWQMQMGEVTIAYGMTETSPVSFQSSTDDPLDKRVTTVGRVQPHLEVKLVGLDGNVVPVGEQGELCTRGYSVMRGYWGDEARTQEAVREGWMYTGDLATLDVDGYCNIVGRVKDMLICGDENIYPREVEEFLFRHPKVQSVQVFGIPDPKYGEEICAWIIPKSGEQATEDEIRDFCCGEIAYFKVPRYIRFVDEMPMTITGKVQKFVMRDRMIDELKLMQDHAG
ncbi:AMP-binding protein [Paraburkholderia sp. BR14374]|uniref:AMP-binding protein n=1 Tax=Paraburkholderia sp. BR14374 TaxID=3237007 RepID=UPI0034CD9077